MEVEHHTSTAERGDNGLVGQLRGVGTSRRRDVCPPGCRSATSRPALWDATGELLISKSAVSEITDQLWADYEKFCERSLDDIEVVQTRTPAAGQFESAKVS